MMKSLLPQSQLRRSAAAARSSGGGGDGAASDGGAGGRAPAASTFWFFLHALCCLISLFLGFRFSRLLFLMLFSTTALYSSSSSSSSAVLRATTTTTMTTTTTTTTTTNTFTLSFAAANPPPSSPVNHSALDAEVASATGTSAHTQSHVVVGRHGIRIRPWPHPDPVEVMRAHRIMERVQEVQRHWYGVKEPRQILVVTPTYSRAFQALHLTGLLHSLRNVPYPLTWMVVEAGGVTNATASLLARSGLTFVHIPFPDRMPHDWADRHATENRMRLHALRVIRERKMDGVVVFADDSNVHSMELFDEVQKVQWMGAVSVGILAHTGTANQPRLSEEDKQNMPLPVQGPACNSSGHLAGWHTFNSLPFAGKTATVVGEAAPVLPRGLEWAGFVLNSRMLWKEADGKPDWAKDLDAVGENGEEIENPLTLLNDPSFVEPLGNCGKKVLLWWLRVEARPDSKFPHGWVIEPPLEVVIPAKRTPWPETTAELSSELLDTKQDQEDRRVSRTNRISSRSRSTTKRKGDLHEQEN